MATVNELQQILNDILADKNTNLLPDNLKEGVSCLGIDGQYEGGIKLFTTQEEMNADDNAKEGDLAAVYRKDTANMTSDMKVQYISFPATVTLPTTITSSTYCMLRGYSDNGYCDAQIEIGQTYFRFYAYTMEDSVSVQYTSTDGIAYTRDTSITNPVDCTVPVQVYYTENWIDAFGYFMQVETNVFEGLFQNQSYVAKSIVKSWTGASTPENPILVITDIDVAAISAATTKALSVGNKYRFYKYNTVTKKGSVFLTGMYPYIINDNGTKYIGIGDSRTDRTYSYADIDFETMTFSNIKQDVDYSDLVSFGTIGNGNYGYGVTTYTEDDVIFCIYDYGNRIGYQGATYFNRNNTDAFTYQSVSFCENYDVYSLKYLIAPTQLTLSNANEILPNKIALGKNGVVTGDGSIYQNLDAEELAKLFNFDLTNSIAGISDMEDGKNGQLISFVKDEDGKNAVPVFLNKTNMNELKSKICTALGISEIKYYWSLPLNNGNVMFLVLETNSNSTLHRVILDTQYNILESNAQITGRTYFIHDNHWGCVRYTDDYIYIVGQTQLASDSSYAVEALCFNTYDGAFVNTHRYVLTEKLGTWSFHTAMIGSQLIVTEFSGYNITNIKLYFWRFSAGLGSAYQTVYNFNNTESLSTIMGEPIVLGNYVFILANLNYKYWYLIRYNRYSATAVQLDADFGGSNIFTDGTYIYFRTYRISTSLSVEDGFTAGYFVGNTQKWDFNITDYLNYNYMSPLGRRYVINGTLQGGETMDKYVCSGYMTKFVEHTGELNHYCFTSGSDFKDIEPPIMCKAELGISKDLLSLVYTANNYIYLQYQANMGTITTEEYEEALALTENILGNEVAE